MEEMKYKINTLADELKSYQKQHGRDHISLEERLKEVENKCVELEKVDISTNHKIERLIEKMDDLTNTIQKLLDKDVENYEHYKKIIIGALITVPLTTIIGVWISKLL